MQLEGLLVPSKVKYLSQLRLTSRTMQWRQESASLRKYPLFRFLSMKFSSGYHLASLHLPNVLMTSVSQPLLLAHHSLAFVPYLGLGQPFDIMLVTYGLSPPQHSPHPCIPSHNNFILLLELVMLFSTLYQMMRSILPKIILCFTLQSVIHIAMFSQIQSLFTAYLIHTRHFPLCYLMESNVVQETLLLRMRAPGILLKMHNIRVHFRPKSVL